MSSAASRTQIDHSGIATVLASPHSTLEATDLLLGAVFDELRQWDEEVSLDGIPGPSKALRIDLVDELAARTANHGKRIRPVVAHWGWVAAGGPESGSHDELVHLAAAMELLHLFALVQDDVMDRSDERRGAPTMHVAASRRHRQADGLGDAGLFGDSVAILLGDLALSEATLLVADAAPAVQALWRRMTVELVQGQLLDVTQAASRQRDMAAARRIARLKSGRYTITRPLQLGALTAGGSASLVALLERYGDLLGEAFAVRDDILGVWGDPARTGKPAGDDLRSAKPTVLLALAHRRIRDADRPLLRRCDAGELHDDDVDELQRALVDCGVREIAERLVRSLAAQATDLLHTLPIRQGAVAGLQRMADAIAWRDA
ncbi:MAG: polyprenyl synthetase family protein [Dermatophilaceae bacterium]